MAKLEVARSTLTGWVSRAEESRLEDRRSVPLRQPQKTPEEVTAEVMGMCFKYPERGGVSLSTFLALNGFTYLSPATINRIKKAVREQCGDVRLPLYQRYEFVQPHDAWSVDLLEFSWQNRKVYVLIVQDDCSRFILNWNVTTNSTSAFIEATLKETMLRHGSKPKLIKADNGPQFRKQFRRWLAENGIGIRQGPPYTPTYNGKVERAYGDLRQAINATLPKSKNLEQVLGGIAQSIYEHNHIWPHQSLAGVTPYHRLAGLEDVVRQSVKQIKQQARNRFGQQLVIPGQPEKCRQSVELIVPGQAQQGDIRGLILPVSGRDGETRAFVRSFIAV
jgi:transposase InsO family protein